MNGKNVGNVYATYERFSHKGPGSDENQKFIWEIKDFYRILDSLNDGDFLDSPKFTTTPKYLTEDFEWHLRLFPKKMCVKVIEGKELEQSGIKAKIHYYLLRDKKKNIRLTEGSLTDSFGDPANVLADNNKLKIGCKVEFQSMVSYNKTKKRKLEDSISSHLKEDYKDLLNDDKFSDISLFSEGNKAVKVHKCILAKRSTVFAAMFDTEMKEKQENSVDISDIKYDVLLEMLRFVYTGKVNDLDILAGELAIAADKYALNDLKVMCEITMSNNLSKDNVIACLRIADGIHMDNLKKTAIEFIAEQAIDVVGAPEFESLSLDLVREINLTRRVKQ